MSKTHIAYRSEHIAFGVYKQSVACGRRITEQFRVVPTRMARRNATCISCIKAYFKYDELKVVLSEVKKAEGQA